mmetsp:Transcript_11171/g.16967  ORF Transcript_11171/g.16967 Transcript_11171/m.16967 type:complete len:652 (-) Transcript_11171:36-1991(-)
MSFEHADDMLTRFANTASNNNALSAYLSAHRRTEYDSCESSVSDDMQHHQHVTRIHNTANLTHAHDDDDDDDDYSSVDAGRERHQTTHANAFNVFNPQSHMQHPHEESFDDGDSEQQSLLQKDLTKDLNGRLLREKVMRNHKYYYSALRSGHIWCMVLVTSLDHLLRKFLEYFCYFLCVEQTAFTSVTFYGIAWSVASLDVAAIVASSFILPFIFSRFSPHFTQFTCQLFIGFSMLCVVFWHSFVGLLVLRFLFGVGYILILSNWSTCIATFVSPSKQSSAIGRVDLAWPFASFGLIVCAYVMQSYGAQYVFYALAILALVASLLLFAAMPSQKLIHSEIHSSNFMSQFASMLRLSLCLQHVPTSVFLGVIGIVTFVNSSLTLLLAPWLVTDYELSIAQFGYCTVIIGTAQMVAIIFSYQFGNKLGVGWSLLAGILVQLLMFVLIALLNSNGLVYPDIMQAVEGSDTHFTFPLLLILLVLAIHFIAAEFTYINAVSCMLRIAPLHIISSKTVAANAMRFVTSMCRIGGALLAPFFWYNSPVLLSNVRDDSFGSVRLFAAVAVIALSVAFLMHLVLMCYIACCHLDKGGDSEDERMMMMSNTGFSDSTSQANGEKVFMFQNDRDYDRIQEDEEMDDEYITKILAANIDYTRI